MDYLAGFPFFVNYLIVSLLLFAAMLAIYVRTTPHAEMKLIREGNTAAAVALAGTMVGLALPLASSVLHTASLFEMVVWAVVGMLAQCIVYRLGEKLIPGLPEGIQQGRTAHGILLAGMSVSVGLINAACIS